MNTAYRDFLASKRYSNLEGGFKPLWMPDFLYDFQAALCDWVVRRGRAAVFADCGLGKTPISLVWAENVVRKTGKPVMVFTPLAVAAQFVREGEKFGVHVRHARDGKVVEGVNVVNYQRMHYFSPSDFGGIVCDESGCLKHHNSETRKKTTEFAAGVPYVLLGTATPAPNDFFELGNSAEVLGVMRHFDMLRAFFINADDPVGNIESTHHFRLKGHARKQFWRWVSGWARAIRKPSDLGFDDGKFTLPPLAVERKIVDSPEPEFGLFTQASSLDEQRKERRRTLRRRCERVASLCPRDRPFIAWCQLNVEGDLLTELLPDAVQVAGSDDDDVKEDRLDQFSRGKIRVLVSKPTIAGFGLNWQHCSDVSYFVSHSWEQWYQAVRRCWRFGQSRKVTVNLVASEAESLVMMNLMRKERAANEMYDGIVREMSEFQRNGKVTESADGNSEIKVPRWLATSK